VDVSENAMLEHASRIRPCFGERVSGDAIVIRPLEGGLFAAIVDVLGHGPDAHQLALLIDAYLTRYASSDIPGLMKRLHQHVKGTRGAAAGLCAIDADEGRVVYAGIGNTVLRRFGKIDTRLVSQDGVLGQNMRTPRLQTLQLEKDDLVVLYTDGVRDRFTAEDYPSIFHHAPKDVVRTLIERFGKDYDDAACIAVRYSG
jgi:negative regulator of sigma-B (phosphoserine phosphatase)